MEECWKNAQCEECMMISKAVSSRYAEAQGELEVRDGLCRN